GHFEESPSVEARLKSFDDSIHQMLWPDTRDKDSVLGDKIPGLIDRIGDRAPYGHGAQPVYLKVNAGYLPEFIQKALAAKRVLFPALFGEDGVRIGPIPKGTPIGLLSNINLLSEDPDPLKRAQYAEKVGALFVQILERLHKLGGNATDEQARAVFADL